MVLVSIIDVHGHVGAWMFPIQARDASDLERIMAACGVEQIILSHVAALTYNFVEGNAQLARSLLKGPPCGVTWCSIPTIPTNPGRN